MLNKTFLFHIKKPLRDNFLINLPLHKNHESTKDNIIIFRSFSVRKYIDRRHIRNNHRYQDLYIYCRDITDIFNFVRNRISISLANLCAVKQRENVYSLVHC